MLRLRNMLTIVWCRFGSWGLVIKSNFNPEFQTLSTKFGQDFEVEAQARLWSWSLFSICCWSLVEVMKLFLVEILELHFVKILKFKFSQNADIWLKLLLGWDYDDELCSRFFWELMKWPKEVTLVTRTHLSGPLCLRQCFCFNLPRYGKDSKHPQFIKVCKL